MKINLTLLGTAMFALLTIAACSQDASELAEQDKTADSPKTQPRKVQPAEPAKSNDSPTLPVAVEKNVPVEPEAEKKQTPKPKTAKRTPKEKPAVESPKIETPSTEPPKTEATQISTNAKFDWPHWRGPHGDNISRETGLIHEFPEDGPEILWRNKLGSGFSGLAIAGGRVFTLFGEEGREKIVCFDADTGDEIWKIDSDADFAAGRSYGPRSTPCVDGDNVYIVGASGKLVCLKAATGKTIWSYNIYDKFNMQRFIHEEGLSCSPMVYGKKLIILAGASAFALDKTSGKVIWQVLEERMNHSTPKLSTLDGREQLVVLSGSHLVGLDLESGREFWRYKNGGANCVTPVIGPDDQIFHGASYGFGSQLIQVKDGTATEVYKNNVLATHHATAMLYKGHLYGFHDRPGIFKCIEFATGEEKWVSRSPGKGKLIIANGQMIIIAEHGALVLATPTPDGYTENAKARIVKGTCFTAPSLANGKLYVRSDEEMVCIEMKE